MIAKRMIDRGFTLLELLVVLTIIAVTTAGVSFAIRDERSADLRRESLRISALLEAARAQSRTSGVPVRFVPDAAGFEFTGIRAHKTDRSDLSGVKAWLSADIRWQILEPRNGKWLVLGPEPLIAPQQLELSLGDQRVVVATDGLAPFAEIPVEALQDRLP